MAFIGLGQIDRNLIPIAVGCIFGISGSILVYGDRGTIYSHLVILNLYLATSQLLSFIPFIILKRRSKKSNIKSDVNIDPNKIEYIYIDTIKGIVKYKYLYILLSSLLSFFSMFSLQKSSSLNMNSWIYDIIFYNLIKNNKNNYTPIKSSY